MSAITHALKNISNIIERNSTVILTGLAVTGTISTAILAVEATPKAMRIIEKAKCETNLEKIKVAWKCYIPAGLVCATTIGCIIGANAINNRKNAALAGLYSLAQSTFKEYQEKVIQTIGENKERKVRDDIDSDRIIKNPPSTDFIYSGTGEVLCYDVFTGRYFNSEIEKIKKIVNELNRRLMTEMFISLNDFHFELGLGSTSLGDNLGFDLDDGLLEVKFSSQLTEEGRPCLVLNYEVHSKYSQ